MNISNNVSSLQANHSFLNTTANNIGKQNGDLAKDMTNLVVSENVNEVNVVAIKAQDEMLGSLLDIKA